MLGYGGRRRRRRREGEGEEEEEEEEEEENFFRSFGDCHCARSQNLEYNCVLRHTYLSEWNTSAPT